MKKHPAKKLVLHKESLLLLENDGLKEVAGGHTTGDSLCIAKTCTC
jgi:hypothetical protein